MKRGRRFWAIIYVIVACWALSSCYRNDIAFGNTPENNYSRLIYVDTISPVLSTVLTDSFVTGSAETFLLGKYRDPYLGIISARPFFQLSIPDTSINIPQSAKYDSVVLMIRLSNYYYGDTSRAQTIEVNELAQTIEYSYNNSLYNTSNVSILPTPIGSRTLRIRPSADSIINIRLSDEKGLDLFSKLVNNDPAVNTADGFLNYFKGITLSVHDGDTTAIYGLKGAGQSHVLRVYYHTTLPGLENKFIDFSSVANTYAFNQILADRRGTTLNFSSGQKEFPSSTTNDLAFTQFGAGVLMKMTFPTIKSVLGTNDIVRLKKAVLIIRPQGYTYDPFIYKLPSSLYLSTTDGTNVIGSSVLDSTSGVEYVSPVIDEIYNQNTYYSFDVTNYINLILTNSGTDDHGFFLLQNATHTSPEVDRAVIGNSLNKQFRTQLQLTLIVIDQ